MTDIARLQHLARSGDTAAAEALALAYRRGARPALPPLPPSVCGGGADVAEIMGAVFGGFINPYLERGWQSGHIWGAALAAFRLGMHCEPRPDPQRERCAQQGEWTTTTQTPRGQTDHITLRNYNPIILPPRRITIADLS